jgi:hypothetical protein
LIGHGETILSPVALAPRLAVLTDDLTELDAGAAITKMAGPPKAIGLKVPAAPIPSLIPVTVPIGRGRKRGHQEQRSGHDQEADTHGRHLAEGSSARVNISIVLFIP